MNPSSHITGEFELIDQIRHWFDDFVPPAQTGSRPAIAPVGIGDDCSVVSRGNGQSDLMTTDLLIEDTHFKLNRISPEDLGYKALAVNLSDIAAMGGTPRYFWLSVGITDHIDISWLERFFTSMRTLAHEFGVRLLGGDTTRSEKHLVINITVSGKAESSHIRYRSGAQPGDIVFVTGVLGDAAGGLRLLTSGHHHTGNPAGQILISAHNRPRPCVDEGQWLARQSAVHALIDVSDGIASDGCHIAEKSGLDMDIRLEQIPLSKELKQIGRQYGWDVIQMACCGGEDYALLGTCKNKHWKETSHTYRQTFGKELYPIGSVRDKNNKNGQIRFLENGNPNPGISKGFDHFKL